MDATAKRVYFEFQIQAGESTCVSLIASNLPDLSEYRIRCAIKRLVRDKHLREVEKHPTIKGQSKEPFYYDAHACLQCGACCKASVIVRLEPFDQTPSAYTKPRRLLIKGTYHVMRSKNGCCILHDPKTHKCAFFNEPEMPWHCRNFVAGDRNPQCTHFRRLLRIPGGYKTYYAASEKRKARLRKKWGNKKLTIGPANLVEDTGMGLAKKED